MAVVQSIAIQRLLREQLALYSTLLRETKYMLDLIRTQLAGRENPRNYPDVDQRVSYLYDEIYTRLTHDHRALAAMSRGKMAKMWYPAVTRKALEWWESQILKKLKAVGLVTRFERAGSAEWRTQVSMNDLVDATDQATLLVGLSKQVLHNQDRLLSMFDGSGDTLYESLITYSKNIMQRWYRAFDNTLSMNDWETTALGVSFDHPRAIEARTFEQIMRFFGMVEITFKGSPFGMDVHLKELVSSAKGLQRTLRGYSPRTNGQKRTVATLLRMLPKFVKFIEEFKPLLRMLD